MDYVQRLTARAMGETPSLQPRVVSPFEEMGDPLASEPLETTTKETASIQKAATRSSKDERGSWQEKPPPASISEERLPVEEAVSPQPKTPDLADTPSEIEARAHESARDSLPLEISPSAKDEKASVSKEEQRAPSLGDVMAHLYPEPDLTTSPPLDEAAKRASSDAETPIEKDPLEPIELPPSLEEVAIEGSEQEGEIRQDAASRESGDEWAAIRREVESLLEAPAAQALESAPVPEALPRPSQAPRIEVRIGHIEIKAPPSKPAPAPTRRPAIESRHDLDTHLAKRQQSFG